MTEDFRRIAAGEIRRFQWQAANQSLPALPVLAARGAKDGPVLLVIGGVHGDEYEGPAAIRALFAELDAANLRGCVAGLPVANPFAWAERARVTPADGVNLNRVFPGSSEGLPASTGALAFAIFEEFVRRCDVLIDLHSGGAALIHLPLIGWYARGSSDAEKLARGFGRAFAPWNLPEVPGVLSREAHRIGKVALGAEWKGGARLDPEGCAAYREGLVRMLQRLDMLPAESEADPVLDTRAPISGDYQETDRAGLFVPTVALGSRIEVGGILGELHDLLGVYSDPVRAERSGILAGLPHIPWLRPGDRVAYIG